MAKVLGPLMSMGVKGKFGDIVFTQRYGQTIARRRTIPANPKTIKQQVVRHNLSALSQAWKGSGDMVYTDTDGKNKVKLWKYDPMSNNYEEVPFEVLSDTEKQAWESYTTQQLRKPMAFARLTFIGMNTKRLMENQDPIRTPT